MYRNVRTCRHQVIEITVGIVIPALDLKRLLDQHISLLGTANHLSETYPRPSGIDRVKSSH